MDKVKEAVAKAVRESLRDSGKFSQVEVHDLEVQDSRKINDTYIRVKEGENTPSRLFWVRFSEVM